MKKTSCIMLPVLLGLALLAPAASGQTGSVRVTPRTPGIGAPPPPTSVVAPGEGQATFLEIIGVLEQLLPTLPDPEPFRAQLEDLSLRVRTLDDEEIQALDDALREMPSLGIQREVLRTISRDLLVSRPTGVIARPEAIDGCPGPAPELKEYPLGSPDDLYNATAAFVIREIAVGIKVVLDTICTVAGCPKDPISGGVCLGVCIGAGVADAIAFIANIVYEGLENGNGDVEFAIIRNVLTYSESLHDLTSSDCRYTDDSERAAQTTTLTNRMDDLGEQMDNVNEGIEDLKESQELMFRLLTSMFADQRAGHDRLLVAINNVRRTCSGGNASSDADLGALPAGDAPTRSGRLELERELAAGHMLPSLYLPEAQGGRIEDVRETVWNAIEAHVSLGYETARTEEATRGAGDADRRLEQGDYAGAYGAYTQAFRHLIPERIATRTEALSPALASPEGEVVDVARTPIRPLLSPPVPNPTTGQVFYSVNLPAPAPVRVRVHDVSGRLVEELVNRSLDAGGHDLTWQPAGQSVPTGVYFLSVEAGDLRASRQVVILR